MTSTYAETENQSQGSSEAAPQTSRGKQSPTPRKYLEYFGRFSIILPAFLTAIYLALWAFYPWRPLAELDSPGWIVDFADQVDMMMTARNPRLVVLGSSLILAAPRRLRRPAVFQQEFSRAAGYPIETACMAVPGAIASDQDFILEQLLAHHKKPALIVYTYAARDFMDNTIEGKISTTPTRRVLTFIDRRASFLPKALTLQACSECFDNHAAFVDLVRRHVLHETRTLTCRLTGHPDSLWRAASHSDVADQSIKQNASNDPSKDTSKDTSQSATKDMTDADEDPAMRKAALAKDLELYQRRYNPQNSERIKTQYEHLENLLKLASQNKIQVALVGMPLSPANKKLLPNDTYQVVARRVADLASRYGASCTDLNTDLSEANNHAFEQDKFLDSAHLSTPGAKAFLPIFVDSVVGSKAFKNSAFRPK